MPLRRVWPDSKSVETRKDGSSAARRCSASASFSWSPLVFGSIAISMTGAASVGALLAIAEQEARYRLLADNSRDVIVLSEVEARRGVGHTIACGVAERPGSPGWLVQPGDMPMVRPSSSLAVADALESQLSAMPECGAAAFAAGVEVVAAGAGTRFEFQWKCRVQFCNG